MLFIFNKRPDILVLPNKYHYIHNFFTFLLDKEENTMGPILFLEVIEASSFVIWFLSVELYTVPLKKMPKKSLM